jgi:hypothetical protein
MVTTARDVVRLVSGYMFSCSVFIVSGLEASGGLFARTLPSSRTSLPSLFTQPVRERTSQ